MTPPGYVYGASRGKPSPTRATVTQSPRKPPVRTTAARVPAGREWTVELPAGLTLLSLNGREHYMARNRVYQSLKKAAWAMTLNTRVPGLERASFTVIYDPPDRRHRDADNTCAASGKACIDGIVAAGVLPNDECPRYVTSITCLIGDEPYPRGRLRIIIREVAP